MTIDISEDERQFLLLALALTVLLRPGFNLPAEALADKLEGLRMYEKFMHYNADVVKPQRLPADPNL
jgi:hypothetical protein